MVAVKLTCLYAVTAASPVPSSSHGLVKWSSEMSSSPSKRASVLRSLRSRSSMAVRLPAVLAACFV